MSQPLLICLGVAIPLLGTTLGAAMVFCVRGVPGLPLQRGFMGFAAGVMIAASVWSLLMPAIDLSRAAGGPAWVPALVGFGVGILFLWGLDCLIPHIRLGTDRAEGRRCGLGRSVMLVLAVTLHNLPEGMAVGVVLAGVCWGNAGMSAAGALALTVGIGIQNFPEGAIISMPLSASGMPRRRAFLYGFLSGVVEPVGALLTILLTSLLSPILPYVLAFAAGAMLYVVVEELIPEACGEGDNDADTDNRPNVGTLGAACGFALMMVLDVALG